MKFGVQVMWMVICVVSVATLNPYVHFGLSVQSKHKEKRLQPRFKKKTPKNRHFSEGKKGKWKLS